MNRAERRDQKRKERIISRRIGKAMSADKRRRQIESMHSSLDSTQMTNLSVQTWAAFRVIADGDIKAQADEGHWGYLASAANISLLLVTESRIGVEFLGDITAAQEALAVCRARADKIGCYVFSGDEYRAVERLLEIHDAQLELATGCELMSAIDKIKQRLKRGQVIEINEQNQ